MTYSKEVTGWILEAHAKGFTAEQTIIAVERAHDVKLSLSTVYRHRASTTAQDIIDELQRQQEFDIATCDDKELKLKYRNELLKLYLPLKIEAVTKSINISKTQVEVNVPALLAEYENILEDTTVPSNSITQQIHPAQANAEASAIPVT